MRAWESFVESVLKWAAEWGRDLPWRHTRDPWAILVSELMSQQTQLSRVIPKWQEFLEKFPTVDEAATAPAAQIITAWHGLGYNRRALYLHKAAKHVHEHFNGNFPSAVEELQSLPGIGPYTARAVAAFAFDQPVGVLDTNVGRILARIGGEKLSPKVAQQLADELAEKNDPHEWNSALLDLGALVCLKRQPKCSRCPVREQCAWQGIGDDPAEGSAAVSLPQSPFEGSFRQGRGRIVTHLRSHSLTHAEVGSVTGWSSEERNQEVVESLIRDGLVVRSGDEYSLAE